MGKLGNGKRTKTSREDILLFRILTDGEVIIEAEGAVAVVAG